MSQDRGGGQDHGAWRARIDAEMGELKRGVNVLFGKMDDLADATNRKLDGLATALHDMRASRPTDWREMLTVVREGAILFALVVAGILYLAGGSKADAVSTAVVHAIDKRVQAVELRLQWTGKAP